MRPARVCFGDFCLEQGIDFITFCLKMGIFSWTCADVLRTKLEQDFFTSKKPGDELRVGRVFPSVAARYIRSGRLSKKLNRLDL